ncbi:MAG TPA: twin-arginine translocase TatA/TatE family subunit [Candidatus Aquilonibacter sp.]
MFSVPDMMVVSVLALLLFGPDQLPKMMRQAGRVMRELQNTSQSFIAEMERAADVNDPEISDTVMPVEPTMPADTPVVHPAVPPVSEAALPIAHPPIDGAKD